MDTSHSVVYAARPVDPDSGLEVRYSILHTKYLWWSTAGFIGFISVLQLTSHLHAKLAGRRRDPSEQSQNLEQAGPARSRHVSLRRFPVAVVNTYRIVAFRCTVGIGSYKLNLAEVLLTAAYIVMLFALTFLNTTSVAGAKLDIAYWGNRAGGLAASQFPLITALGTKNNIIGYLTGMSYDKLNYLHRMTSRVSFVLLWVHAASHIAPGTLSKYLGEVYIRAGLLAMVAFSILILVSLRPVRSSSYEIFFYAHFLLVAIMLVGAYVHAANFKMGYYIWPALLIWFIDRFVRVVRLVVFNHSYFGFKSGSGTMDATTELLSDDFIRLRMRRPSHFHWSPGQTAYLILPGVSTLPFEAHPFTIGSIDSSLLSDNTSEKNLGESAPYWKELVFLIQAREGFTKRLRESALVGEKVKVFVDGPYGLSPDLGKYDTSVLVAGGTGVSYTLPVFLNIIERTRKGTSNCTKVVFIWAVRDIQHLGLISDTLVKALQLIPASLKVDIRIFVTGANGSILTASESVTSFDSYSTNSDGHEKKEGISDLLAHSAVRLIDGRPDLDAILGQEAEETFNGRMSVSVCGSQAIASAVRKGLQFSVAGTASVMRGGPSVTLHVESFGYA